MHHTIYRNIEMGLKKIGIYKIMQLQFKVPKNKVIITKTKLFLVRCSDTFSK
jgi:hypothetical protein